MIFRKKPIMVEATQWHKPGDHPAVICRTFGSETESPWVQSKQGRIQVHPGDWIITEPDASGHYPCHPDVFAATYEPALDETANPRTWDELPEHAKYVLESDGDEPVKRYDAGQQVRIHGIVASGDVLEEDTVRLWIVGHDMRTSAGEVDVPLSWIREWLPN